MGLTTGRVRESLPSDVNQPLTLPAFSGFADWQVAETVDLQFDPQLQHLPNCCLRRVHLGR